jgi:hypothetical protein
MLGTYLCIVMVVISSNLVSRRTTSSVQLRIPEEWADNDPYTIVTTDSELPSESAGWRRVVQFLRFNLAVVRWTPGRLTRDRTDQFSPISMPLDRWYLVRRFCSFIPTMARLKVIA